MNLLVICHHGEYIAFFTYGYVTNPTNNINSLPADMSYINVVFCRHNDYTRTVSYENWQNNGSVLCAKFEMTNFQRYAFWGNEIISRPNNPENVTLYYPNYLVNYRSNNLTQYVVNYFKISDEDLGQIIQNTTNSVIESNQQVQNAVQEQTNTVKEQIDFLTNNTVSDNSITLPTDTSQDNTGVDDEINFIFDDIMNSFTDTSNDNYIRLTFPFTNQTFDISYASIYNGVFENNNSMAYLKRIIQLGYWYIIAVFVIKDISDKINKVKTGDIDKIQTGNIKEDLL